MKTLRKYWDEKPLLLILSAAAFFRIIAVIFSKGYAMHDDHFLVIEAAQSWLDGADYNDWLPSDKKMISPTGHSLLYPGLHYILFSILQFFGMTEPGSKMYVVRLLHAVLSMSVVLLGYKIALRRGGMEAAKMSGLLLAILFFMPMMSVRNLVEFVCIPPLLYATWILLNDNETKKTLPAIIAGLVLSIAISIRFQTAMFIGGFGLALLIQKRWKETFLVTIGFLAGVAIIQSMTDIIIWKKPFMELQEYIRYNLVSSGDYPNLRWYAYLLLISGILIPPISLFLIFGFFNQWKKNLLLFLPTLIFFVFHSSFPNKQERFIMPVIPFIIILGSIGWCNFRLRSGFWARNKKLYRSCWIFFFALNTVPLFFISAAYSHRSRVESMVYLAEKKDVNNILVEESNHDYFTMPPRFYLKVWKGDYFVTSVFTVDSMAKKLSNSPKALIPNYIVFNQPENLDQRIQNMKRIFPKMVFETKIEPGFIDKVMHYLNKHNANFTSYIYRTE